MLQGEIDSIKQGLVVKQMYGRLQNEAKVWSEKRLSVQAGHRQQLYGAAFTREHFMRALDDGPAVNPFHESDPSQQEED